MTKDLDCVLCGSCVADILCRPVALETPIGGGRLLQTEPLQVVTGGIVCNAGVAMARLGMKTAAFSYVGRDEWARLVRGRLEAEGMDCAGLMEHPTASTSTTVVLIDPSGERSFAHCVGAPKLMNGRLFLEHIGLFARSRMALIGYYSLMPNLEGDLEGVLARSARPVAARRWTARAAAGQCSRWTVSCRTWMCTFPVSTRPVIRPA